MMIGKGYSVKGATQMNMVAEGFNGLLGFSI